MAEDKLPCIILGYSRIESLTKLVLRAQCLGFDPIYISIDGPANSNIAQIQSRMRAELERIAGDSAEKIFLRFNKINLGVAAGIISGIDWFFSNEKYGAILEDDLQINDDFLKFLSFGKEFLETNPSCLMVSGCRFSDRSDDIVLTSYPLIWGWGTSNKNWWRMRKGILTPPKKKLSFNARENYWLIGARRVHDGYIDTWDIPLVYFMLKNKFSCLLPPTNLTTNIGFDENAIHTKHERFPLGLKNVSLPRSTLKSMPLNSSTSNEDEFLERNVYQVNFRHKFLSIYFWSTRLFLRPRFASLRSRIADI